MSLSISVRPVDLSGLDAFSLAIALPPAAPLTAALRPVDAALNGALARTLERKDFGGAKDEVLHLAGGSAGPQRVSASRPWEGRRQGRCAPASSLSCRSPSAVAWNREAGVVRGRGVQRRRRTRSPSVCSSAHGNTPTSSRRRPTEEQKPRLSEVAIHVDDATGADAAVRAGVAIGAGYDLARKLAMMPGNVCTPDYLADTARDLARRHELAVAVLGRTELTELKMGAFLCVAQGTPQDPKLLVLEYRKGPQTAKPIVFVGKGLCFDSGGISIKPAQGMEFMKFDMCGAAGVLGAMEAIARLGLPINVIGIVGATTNMPSGTAMNPGDVVRASSGTSIEVINTDAEGRLVLADLLAYAGRFEPTAVIDAATLTGACVIALGHLATGIFGTDAALVREVIDAGERVGERAWQLPLWEEYKEAIKSDVADLKNTGGRPAGSITAAKFLEAFATGYPWVHLDIAGTAYSESDLVAIPKGPTGVPVGMFVEFARGRAR